MADIETEPHCERELPEAEVTPAMIEAGVSVLEADPYIDLGSGYTESIARRVIVAALSVRRPETREAS